MSFLSCTRACRGSSSTLKSLQLRRPLATVASDAVITPRTYDDSYAFTKNLTVRRTAKHDADTVVEGPMRPHLGIEVNPQHGLHAFFRQAQGEGQDGKYLTLDARHATKDTSGRSWTAPELRRKSFKDIHTLWYVLLRERNLLATQEHEGKRLGVFMEQFTSTDKKKFRCKKSMARIKCVLNERRLAYKQAVEIYDAQQLGVTVKDSTATSLAAPPASSIDSMFEEVRETEKVEGSVTQRV